MKSKIDPLSLLPEDPSGLDLKACDLLLKKLEGCPELDSPLDRDHPLWHSSDEISTRLARLLDHRQSRLWFENLQASLAASTQPRGRPPKNSVDDIEVDSES